MLNKCTQYTNRFFSRRANGCAVKIKCHNKKLIPSFCKKEHQCA